MARKFITKIALITLFATLVMYILSLTTNITIQGFQTGEIAGILSVIIGVFSFAQQKALARKTKITHIIFQSLLLIIGATILIPQVHEFFQAQNQFLDGIIIGLLLLLLLGLAYATKNEKVSKSEISSAESLLEPKTKKRSKKKETVEDIDEKQIQELLKRAGK